MDKHAYGTRHEFESLRPTKMMDTVACICNPRLQGDGRWEVEIGVSPETNPASLLDQAAKQQEDPISDKIEGGLTHRVVLCSPHVYTWGLYYSDQEPRP